MIDEDAYKSWLERGGARSSKARNTRTYALRKIERNLSELGTPFRDLDAAWREDRFKSLLDALRRMREDMRNGGQNYRVLMPKTKKPSSKRLLTWINWLKQYGRFLDGDPPGPRETTDADRIRRYVLEHYIEPAREEGDTQAEVLVSEVNTGLGLTSAWPNICQALAGHKLQELAAVPPPLIDGPPESPATVFNFDLRDTRIDTSALDKLRKRFTAICPDFKSFASPGTGRAKAEQNYKLEASKAVQTAVAEGADDTAVGRAVFDVLCKAKGGPLVRWQTRDSIEKQHPELLYRFHATVGQLVRSRKTAEEALSQAFNELDALREGGATVLTYGERLNLLFSALAMVRQKEAAPLKITWINKAWEQLTGEKLFIATKADMPSDYRRFAAVFHELFVLMRDEWQWQPNNWLDLQLFLYVVLDDSAAESLERDPASKTGEERGSPMPITPENIILYGPPGTGKTYSTATEAVRLCGEEVPEDREALMQVYQQLLAAGRIEFVTFHQSMSYEDFVEGRQPETRSDEDADGTSAGFRLETIPGVFRRIARRAETSLGQPAGSDAITIAKRHVFKMSIGEASNPEDDHLFEEALADGYALLGWDDIDWTDEKYAERDAIINECKAQGHTNVDAQSGRVQMPDVFRNSARKGDIVIVSKGNSLFRAIGEFTGDYEFHPQPEGGYAHRRAVHWRWVDREGLPVNEIYTRNFSRKTMYQLDGSELITPAVERYLNSPQTDVPTEPEPFVLIIDEINRSNISKVFGELITLLEPDKRLGHPNALTVRLPYSGDKFGVPSNLHILGTMNTADRSIALLDTALRRRFTFREMMPDSSLLTAAGEKCGLDLPRILDTLNNRIEYLYDREHQIGHAYFLNCASRGDLDAVMRHKVIPLLAEYFFEDWGKIAAALGDAASHDGEINGGFLKRSVLKAPPGLEDGDDLPRFRWEVRSEDEGFDYGKLTET